MSSRNKGQAWGAAKKRECPHCHKFKGGTHPKFCKSNPDRDEEAAKRRTAAALKAKETRARNEQRRREITEKKDMVIKPTPTPDPEPEPQPTPKDPLADLTKTPSETPATEPTAPAPAAASSPDFMQRRIEELRGGDGPKPAAQDPVPVIPSNAGVQEKRGVGSAAIAKIGMAVAAIGLGWVAFKFWFKGRKSTGESTEPVDQRWQGPRAWTPEPEKLTNDVAPAPGGMGGGMVPSPQSAWDKDQRERLKRQQQM